MEVVFSQLKVMGFGEFISLVFQSLYIYDYLDNRGFVSISLVLLTVIITVLLILGLIYLTVQTLRMKKNITAMGTVLGQEGEVVKLLDDFGKKGWISIYGENWKFRSKKALKVGYLVKVIKYKKMSLIVEKIEEDI